MLPEAGAKVERCSDPMCQYSPPTVPSIQSRHWLLSSQSLMLDTTALACSGSQACHLDGWVVACSAGVVAPCHQGAVQCQHELGLHAGISGSSLPAAAFSHCGQTGIARNVPSPTWKGQIYREPQRPLPGQVLLLAMLNMCRHQRTCVILCHATQTALLAGCLAVDPTGPYTATSLPGKALLLLPLLLLLLRHHRRPPPRVV